MKAKQGRDSQVLQWEGLFIEDNCSLSTNAIQHAVGYLFILGLLLAALLGNPYSPFINPSKAPAQHIQCECIGSCMPFACGINSHRISYFRFPFSSVALMAEMA